AGGDCATRRQRGAVAPTRAALRHDCPRRAGGAARLPAEGEGGAVRRGSGGRGVGPFTPGKVDGPDAWGRGRSYSAAASTASASRVAATAWTTAAILNASWTASRSRPALRSTCSWESRHAPQPLIAETAKHQNSKSTLSTPGLPMTFIRRPARRLPYSWSDSR